MRRAVKRSSKRFLIAVRDNRERWRKAPTALVSSSTTKPVTPSSINSGTAPRLNAMTGAPQAMASIMTNPKGSGQSIGTSKAKAPLKNSDFFASEISPMNSTCGFVRSG